MNNNFNITVPDANLKSYEVEDFNDDLKTIGKLGQKNISELASIIKELDSRNNGHKLMQKLISNKSKLKIFLHF